MFSSCAIQCKGAAYNSQYGFVGEYLVLASWYIILHCPEFSMILSVSWICLLQEFQYSLSLYQAVARQHLG